MANTEDRRILKILKRLVELDRRLQEDRIGGLTLYELSRMLHVSKDTVKRNLKLFEELGGKVRKTRAQRPNGQDEPMRIHPEGMPFFACNLPASFRELAWEALLAAGWDGKGGDG